MRCFATCQIELYNNLLSRNFDLKILQRHLVTQLKLRLVKCGQPPCFNSEPKLKLACPAGLLWNGDPCKHQIMLFSRSNAFQQSLTVPTGFKAERDCKLCLAHSRLYGVCPNAEFNQLIEIMLTFASVTLAAV